MYGLVLMAALTTAPDAAASDIGFVAPAVSSCYGSSCFGSSCQGVTYASGACHGSSCYSSGCYSSSCYSSGCYSSCSGSCQGRGLLSGLRARLASRFSGCQGRSCHSSCYSSSCYSSSCYSSSCYSSSCYSSHASSCYGSSACYGSSCHSSSCYGGVSSAPVYYGQSSFAPSASVVVGSSLYGDASGCFTVGSSVPSATVPTITINNTDVQVTKAKLNSAPARITVELPADAKLYVDGQLTKGEGESRNFHTPSLASGQTFYYELKAEMLVDGKTVTEEKRVLIQTGDALTESFPKLIAAANSAKKTEIARK